MAPTFIREFQPTLVSPGVITDWFLTFCAVGESCLSFSTQGPIPIVLWLSLFVRAVSRSVHSASPPVNKPVARNESVVYETVVEWGNFRHSGQLRMQVGQMSVNRGG